MFKAFLRTIPQVSIFHNPASPASIKALKLLQSAIASPYPPSRSSALPLKFDLEVVENRPPTSDQLRTILSYLPSKPLSPDVLLSAHPTVDARPTNVEGVSQLASQNPHALKWPIVVDWNNGKAAVGDIEGVKAILEELRKKRDGEE
ncbi:thioredoxin-like protein [Trametes meyenii]|nr:thioredoxin-like protein [Trametes meyenii]